MAIPIGQTLSETLIFCLVPQNRVVMGGDLALWEREPESVETLRAGPCRTCNGFADLYLWRTRSIRLEQQFAASGEVRAVALASGVGFISSNVDDPMLGYRVSKENGRYSVQFGERSFWRDFQSLLPDGSDRAPKTVENAITLGRAEPNKFPRSVLVLGFANKPGQAKIEFWRMERFCLPGIAKDFRRARIEVEALLKRADEGVYEAKASGRNKVVARAA